MLTGTSSRVIAVLRQNSNFDSEWVFIPENPSAGGKSTIPEKKIQEKKGLLKTLHTLFRI